MKIKQRINKIALWIAFVSFILGTLLLISYGITERVFLADIGIFYVAITSILNAIVFVALVINAIINRKHYKENLITILLISLNIPIVYGYIWIAELIYFGKLTL